jgi:hypothetical protein
MTEGLNNDCWLESDGKKIGFFEMGVSDPYYGTTNGSGLQGSGGLFYITKLCKVERAIVQPSGGTGIGAGAGWSGGTNAGGFLSVGGISGNQVTVYQHYTGSTTVLSGCSGCRLTFVVIGQ